MLETLLSHLPSIWTIAAGICGGGLIAGLIRAYRTYWTQQRKGSAQDHEQDIELSGRLDDRLTKVEDRLDTAEQDLRETRKELTQSQIRREELQAAIDALVQRIDRLIDRLEEHEKITEEERARLTSVPHTDHNANT